MADGDHARDPQQDWEALGGRLAQLRGEITIPQLAALQDQTPEMLSESTLRRFEKGRRIRLEHAHHVDELYRGGGEIEGRIRLLLNREAPLDRPILDVPSDAIVKRSVYWPKDYSGDVWLQLLGTNPDVQRIWLSWGGWRTVVDVRLTKHPVLVTGQTATHDDGRDPLIVESVVDFTLESGVAPVPPDSATVRLHHRWHPVEPDRSTS